MHTPLLLLFLAVIPTVAMPVAWAIRHRRRTRRADSPAAVEPPAGVEAVEPLQSMRGALEQLNDIATMLRNAKPAAAGLALATTGPGQDGENGGDPPSAAPGMATPLQTDQPTPGAATREQNLAHLAKQMRQLTELTNSLHEEWRALERSANEPAPDTESRESAAANRHYLSFTLGDERFAISTLHVIGVVEAIQLIVDPALPSKIRRAIKLQGALVPVVDLGAHLGGQPLEIGWSSRIVVFDVPRDGSRQTIGVLVDTVGKMLEIDPTDIEPPPSFGTHIHSEFILGIGRFADRFVILLEIERLLSSAGPALPPAADQATHQEHRPT